MDCLAWPYSPYKNHAHCAQCIINKLAIVILFSVQSPKWMMIDRGKKWEKERTRARARSGEREQQKKKMNLKYPNLRMHTAHRRQYKAISDGYQQKDSSKNIDVIYMNILNVLIQSLFFVLLSQPTSINQIIHHLLCFLEYSCRILFTFFSGCSFNFCFWFRSLWIIFWK